MSYIYDLTDTWNAGGTVFTAIKMNVTNSASASGSKIISLQVNGTEQFSVDKDGKGYVAGNLGIGTTSPLSVSGYKTLTLNDASGGAVAFNVNGTIAGSIASFSNDMYYDAVDATVFRNGAAFNGTPTERMRLDGSGNVGLGGTPSAWGTAYKALQIAGQGTSVFGSTVASTVGIGSNGYYDGTNWVRNNSDAAGQYQIAGNVHRWYSAAAGSAGTTISFTQAMTLDASGNLGIGTSSPSAKVEAAGTGVLYSLKYTNDAGNALIAWKNTSGTTLWDIGGGVATAQDELAFRRQGSTVMLLNSSGNVGIGTSSPAFALDVASATARIRVAPSTATNNALFQATNGGGSAYLGLDNSSGGLGGAYSLNLWHSGAYPIVFATNNTERARIDSSGNLLVGKTASNFDTTGMEYLASSKILRSTTASNAALQLQRTTTTGDVAQFWYDTVLVGSISVTGSATTYNTSSDARLKENIADADSASNLIDQIKVRKYDWKSDGSHQRYGFVAQELVEVAPEAVSVPADEEAMMGVDYSKLVPMLVKEIQSLRARVAQLEGK